MASVDLRGGVRVRGVGESINKVIVRHLEDGTLYKARVVDSLDLCLDQVYFGAPIDDDAVEYAVDPGYYMARVDDESGSGCPRCFFFEIMQGWIPVLIGYDEQDAIRYIARRESNHGGNQAAS